MSREINRIVTKANKLNRGSKIKLGPTVIREVLKLVSAVEAEHIAQGRSKTTTPTSSIQRLARIMSKKTTTGETRENRNN